jgi:hypothetical protein
MEGSRFLVFDFLAQKPLGIFEVGATVDLGKLPPHASRLLRVTEWNGNVPVLAGTDLHFSGGGVEVTQWRADENEVNGQIETKWNCPVRVTAAFPTDVAYVAKTATVKPGQNIFHIRSGGGQNVGPTNDTLGSTVLSKQARNAGY